MRAMRIFTEKRPEGSALKLVEDYTGYWDDATMKAGYGDHRTYHSSLNCHDAG